MIYYYTLPDDPYKIESTDNIDDFVSQLYYHKANLPTIAQLMELHLANNYNDQIKIMISQYEGRVPLFDVISNRIYLIDKDNIYPRIHLDNYRFVDKKFYASLKSLNDKDEANVENLRVLSNYNLDVLYQTYISLFYQSYVLNNYITNCKRPSFFPGSVTMPYYTINELYYLAYDWDLTNNPTFSQSQIEDFCTQISKYDISAQTLLDHQTYIYDERAIGLVKHYSLFGSYYMNVYLRKNLCCLSKNCDIPDNAIDGAHCIKNPYLEDQIKIMIKLIKNAPALAKNHTVYRFVQRDDYLKHLKISDIYQDPSFMSTTRNPFYYKENYAFGYILIKIKLPANVMGIGLFIESYSNFPHEEEFVLPPTSKYKLIKVTDASDTSEFHNIFNLKVQKKYEFEWIGADANITLISPPITIADKVIELDKILVDENMKYVSISDRLKYFRSTYVNDNSQFSSIIGSIKYTFNLESYDSTSVYKKFFFYQVATGIMITTANPIYGNINIMMEIGPEIHINYYFRFSVTDPSIVVDLNQSAWIEWLSYLAYIIGVRTIVIHSNYIMLAKKTDSVIEKQRKTRYTFSQNIYIYMKHGTKMYEFSEITPNFDYYQFDYLRGINVLDHIKESDQSELYRIYQNSKIQDMYNFYLYIVETFPQYINDLEHKMDDVYESDVNPFRNMSYSLDAWRYLYSRDIIKQIPSEKEFIIKKGSFKHLVGDNKIPKFKNRLRTFLMSK